MCGKPFQGTIRQKMCSHTCTRLYPKHLRMLRNPPKPASEVAQMELKKDLRLLLRIIYNLRLIISKRDRIKRCPKCKQILPFEAFKVYRNWCNACEKDRCKSPEFKKKRAARSRKWHKSAKERQTNGYKAGLLRRRIHTCLSRARISGGRREYVKYLGCTSTQAVKYIESLFRPGMTWENHGSKWEIDHIRPIVSYDMNNDAEKRKAFHYTNIRPLWKWMNRQKKDKITVTEHQPGLLI